jgi:RNA 2',3'-cyclic 3'-phosphodiesterase
MFIALDLPIGVREDLTAWARTALRAAAAADPQQRSPGERREEPSHGRGRHRRGGHDGSRRHGIRVLEADLLHITISFLGSRPVEQLQPLSALVESIAQPSMGESSIGAPVWLPTRRPKVLAVEVHDDSRALAELHEIVHADLQAAGLESPPLARGHRHDRAFRPHVTVARLRDGAAPGDRALQPTPQRAFVAPRLTLYRSWLSPEGASYEQIACSATVPSVGG